MADVSQFQTAFCCLACGRRYASRPALVEHLVQEHSSIIEIGLDEEVDETHVQNNQTSRPSEVLSTTAEQSCPETVNYSCKLCDQTFRNMTECMDHTQAHIRNRKCSVCNLMFKSELRLKKHVLAHMKVEEYLCILCGKTFPVKNHLRVHSKLVHMKDNACGMCGGIFQSSGDINKHFNKAHKTEEIVRSEIQRKVKINAEIVGSQSEELHGYPMRSVSSDCGRVSNTVGRVYEHTSEIGNKNEVIPQKKKRCISEWRSWVVAGFESGSKQRAVDLFLKSKTAVTELPTSDFEKRTQLVDKNSKHAREKLNKRQRRFKCKCGSAYRYSDGIKRHVEEVHLKMCRHFCWCGLGFYTRLQLKVHQNVNKHLSILDDNSKNETMNGKANGRQKYTNESSKMCDKCGTIFPTSGKLNKHLSTHHMKCLNCLKCDQNFHDENELKRHLELHDMVNAFVCDLCGMATNSQHELKSHHLFSHGNVGDPRFACRICGRRFASRQTLSSHRKLHDDLKKHKCDLCNRRFHQKFTLNRHRKDVHLNIKPYKCELCSKQFRRKHHLIMHEKQHSNFPGYECSICSKKFRTQTQIDYHMNRFHSIVNTDELLETDFQLLNDGGVRAEFNSDLLNHQIETDRELFDEYPSLNDVLYRWRCATCEQSFTDLNLLKKHLEDNQHGTLTLELS